MRVSGARYQNRDLSIMGALPGMGDRDLGRPGQFDDSGPFWTNRPDVDVFARILDHLFAIDSEAWSKELAETGFAQVMAYDPGNAMLRRTLNGVLA